MRISTICVLLYFLTCLFISSTYSYDCKAPVAEEQLNYGRARYERFGYNESGENQQSFNQSVSGENQQSYNQSVSGEDRQSYNQSVSGENQQSYNQSVSGENQQSYNQSVSGENQQSYNQSVSGENQQSYNQSVRGENQQIYNQSVSGENQQSYNQSVSLAPRSNKTEDSALSGNQSAADRSSDNRSGNTTTQAGGADSQRDHSLEFLFGNLSRDLQNEEWCWMVGIHLDLSFNDLTYLPDTLFNKSCANSVKMLTLSNNRIGSLTQNTLKPLTNLRYLDLSHNHLSFLPPGSLPPSSLHCLDLSFNSLTELREDALRSPFNYLYNLDLSHNNLSFLAPRFLPSSVESVDLSFNNLTALHEDVFRGPFFLERLDLSHNSISDVPPGVFHAGMAWLEWVSLAHNKLTALDAWPYVLDQWISVNVSHNMISRFTNRMNVTLDREITGSGVDLTYNNLTTLNQTELSSYFGGGRLSAMEIYVKMKMSIKHNPVVCDCDLYWIVEATEGALLTLNTEAQNFFTCAAPDSLAGRPLGYLLQHPDLLVCDVTEDCPEGCQCLDTPHRRHLAITCPPSRHNYTHIPRTLPGHGPLSLNLSRQALSSLEVGSGDLSRLHVLDVSNNRVRQVSNSFLDAASSLQVLDLRNNLLTSLPSNLQRLSVSNLSLSGNPLQCTCDLVRFGKWVKAVADNATSSETAEAVDVLTLQCSLSDGRRVAIADTDKWELDCGSRVTLYALVGGGVALLLVVAAMVMCWRWRYHVRVLLTYMSSLRCLPCCVGKPRAAKRGVYDMPHGEVQEEYDVYISLDEDDEKILKWVKSWLLPLLENRGRNPSRVYLPLRQELPGVCKAESRVQRIGQSNKVLVILSPGYVNNGWCRHEFDHACRHVQDHNPKNLVIVVMDNDPEVRMFIKAGNAQFIEDGVQRRISKRPESEKRDSAVCGVDVDRCNCDAKRQSGADVVVDVAQNDVLRPKETATPLNKNGYGNLPFDGGVTVEQLMLDDIGTGHNGGQNIDAVGNEPVTNQARPQVINKGNDAGRNVNKEDKDKNIRRGISKHKRGKGRSKRAQAERKATEELEGKQLRLRQFLEKLSQYTEGGQQVALEPLRSFLLEGRYVSASDWLFKYEIVFEISRIRREVDFIDCD